MNLKVPYVILSEGITLSSYLPTSKQGTQQQAYSRPIYVLYYIVKGIYCRPVDIETDEKL